MVTMVAMINKVKKETKRHSENMLRRQGYLNSRYFRNLVKALRVLKRYVEKVRPKDKDLIIPGANSPSVVPRELRSMLLSELIRLPNRLHFSVSLINQVTQSWGLKPVFSFEVSDHSTIGKKVGIDNYSGARIVGTRFSVLKKPVSIWSRVLVQLMLGIQTEEHLYEELHVPCIVNELSLYLTGHLPKFRSEMFRVLGNESGWYLIPTSEVVLVNLVRGVTLEGARLPLRLAAYSSCFRLEHSLYGTDNRGLLRQRQFSKVEIIQVTPPSKSYRALNEVLKDAESVLRLLRLHYRVTDLGASDTGLASSKTFDIEAWFPSFLGYREVSSCSNTEDYQAMRLQAKHSLNQCKRFVHIINGSGLAVGRTLVSMLEVTQPIGSPVVIS